MVLSKIISRRQAIVGAALAGTSLVGSKLLFGADSKSSTLSSSDRELSVIPGGSANFTAAVESLYPGLTSNPAFQAIAPLAVLISHKSGPSVRAYTVNWTLSTATDSTVTSLYHYKAPGTRRQKQTGRVAKSVASGQRPLMKRGETHLVSPYFAWSPKDYEKRAANDWTRPLKKSEPAGFLTSQLQSSPAPTVQVAVDAVVFSDRKVAGPDTANLAGRLQARRNGEHDAAVSISRFLRSGASAADVQDRLYQQGTKPRSTVDGPAGWYAQARRHQAQVLYKLHARVGTEKFTHAVNQLKKLHKTNIKAISA